MNDRSDIALQTGLALTHNKVAGGSSIANNSETQKKITLPYINHQNAGGTAASLGGTNAGGISASVVSNKGGVVTLGSKYPSVSTQGLAMQASSLQSAYL